MARKRTIRPEAPAPAASLGERAIQTFQYARPPSSDASRTIVDLCHGDQLRGEVHVMRAGSRSGLRRSPASDELWFVLQGHAQVIGPAHTLLGEFTAGDGLLIPRGTHYRLVNVGRDDLEMLMVSGAGGRATATEVAIDDGPGDEVERTSGRVV